MAKRGRPPGVKNGEGRTSSKKPKETGLVAADLAKKTFSEALDLIKDRYPEEVYMTKIGHEGMAVVASREFTAEAIATLVAVMRHAKADSNKIKAATALLDRGWGTATKNIEVKGSVEHQHAHELTDEELVRIIKEQREKDSIAEFSVVIDAEEALEKKDAQSH